MKNVETMRYHTASAGDVSKLSLQGFAVRWTQFRKVHEENEKLKIAMAKLGMRLPI